MNGQSLAAIPKPAETIILADGINWVVSPDDDYPVVGTNYYPVHYRHLDTATIGFLDGHVKSMNIGAVRRQAATEDGVTLSGNDQYVLWNRY